MTKPRISVLINTYNRAEHLRNCLEGYLRQTERDFEVVVADDGSSDDTDEVVKEFAARAPGRVEHVWHEDKGHRRTVILNRGIVACETPYILFTDCDALPPANLLQTHLELRTPERMLCGGFVDLTADETRRVNREFVGAGGHEAFLNRERRRALRLRHWKNCYQIAIRRRRRPHNLGLNFSLAKEDLLAINGYDEEFRGWGSADGDVRERLRMVGVQPKSIWYQAVIFHQYHAPDPSKSMSSLQKNKERARRESVSAFCQKGLEQELGDGPRS